MAADGQALPPQPVGLAPSPPTGPGWEVENGAASPAMLAVSSPAGPRLRADAVVKMAHDWQARSPLPDGPGALAGGQSLGVATLSGGSGDCARRGIEAPCCDGQPQRTRELNGSCRTGSDAHDQQPTPSPARQSLASGSAAACPCTLKLDTGMTRLGIDWPERAPALACSNGPDAVQVPVYSHLADACTAPMMATPSPDRLQKLRWGGAPGVCPARGVHSRRHLCQLGRNACAAHLPLRPGAVGLGLYGPIALLPHLGQRRTGAGDDRSAPG